ncbi:MAG: hypothetical protein PHD95_00365 [Candidatus ainarchaeum sp.]|nr:hypothetical protein [Candidatus ainarchaeum sp.]
MPCFLENYKYGHVLNTIGSLMRGVNKNRRKTGGVLRVGKRPLEVGISLEDSGFHVFPDVRYRSDRMSRFKTSRRFSNKIGSDRWHYNQFLKPRGFWITQAGDIVKPLPGNKFRFLKLSEFRKVRDLLWSGWAKRYGPKPKTTKRK